MKKLLKAYRVFTPDLYTVFAFFFGTVLIAGGGFVLRRHLDAKIVFTACGVMAILLDAYTDYFVFQGIFAKNYEFGILKNSLRGMRLLRLGIMADSLRRLTVLTVVLLVSGIGAISPVTILSLIFIAYSAETFALHLLRMIENFLEGALAGSLVLIAPIAVFASMTILLTDGPVGYSLIALPVFVGLSVIATITIIKRIQAKFKRSFHV